MQLKDVIIPTVQAALKMVITVTGVIPLVSVRSGTGQTFRPVKEINIFMDNVTWMVLDLSSYFRLACP